MLPAGTGRASVRWHAIAEGLVVLAPATVSTAALVHHSVAVAMNGWPCHWSFAHDPAGAPVLRGGPDLPPAVSIAATERTRALLLGDGLLGIDVETLHRVALNARIDDDWLAPAEQALLQALPPPGRSLELACRWVLREAYGKASGRGLDLPLARLAFTVRSGAVTLPMSLPGGSGWTFSLHRRGSLVLGVAAAGSGG